MALWLLAGIFTAAGMPFVLVAERVFARDRRIRRWPRAPGVITQSTLEKRTETRRDEDHWGVEETRYRPRIHYTYEVSGGVLQGDRIGRDDGWMDERPAQALLDRYRPQHPVEVLYDPNAPTTAYLEITRSVGAVILAVWGGVFLFVGALLAFLALVL